MTTIKCVVVGDGTVGKTCILITYVKNTFPTEYIPTVFENHCASLSLGDKPYTLNLFDTAGQEEYDRLRPLAYPGTDVFLVCFSTDSRDSLNNVRNKWVEEITHYCPTAPFILVGTKIDLRNNAEENTNKFVSYEEGEKLASTLKAAKYMECSALRRQGINEIFEDAVRAASGQLGKTKTKSKQRKCAIL